MTFPRLSSEHDAELKHLYARLRDIESAIRSLEKFQRLSRNRRLDVVRRVLGRAA
jgi:hypothetical protein